MFTAERRALAYTSGRLEQLVFTKIVVVNLAKSDDRPRR